MKAIAPFTDEQVKNIREWQESKHTHHLTCGRDKSSTYPLAVTHVGLICHRCDYKQNWVPEYIADGTGLINIKDTIGSLWDKGFNIV